MPTMKFDPVAIFGIPVVALVFLFLSWSYCRSVRRGQPLTLTMRKMLLYGFIFVLCTGYSFAIASMLGWRNAPWPLFGVAWVLLLSVVAWRRSRTPS
jgi:hypothetical protein